MDAIILAGGETPEKLSAALGASTPVERALLPLNGRPAIDYVLQSLRETALVETVVVVGQSATLAHITASAADAVGVAAGSTLVDNVLAGMKAASSDQALLCTCDIPLVTANTWREFLKSVAANNLEAAYPICERANVEKDFPGGKRTYVTLREGTFTGGNAFVLPRARADELKTLIDAAYRARKNPLGLAKLLGLGFVVKAVRRKLSIADVERKMSQILQCRAGAIQMRDAGIAFDVDKFEDLQIAQNTLRARKH